MLYEPVRALGCSRAGGGLPVVSETDWATRQTTIIPINTNRLESVLSEEHNDLRYLGLFRRGLLTISVKCGSAWKTDIRDAVILLFV